MKEIDEKQLKISILITKKEGVPVEVEARGKYIITSDGISTTRNVNINVTGTTKTQLLKFGKDVVTLIKQMEGIPS